MYIFSFRKKFMLTLGCFCKKEESLLHTPVSQAINKWSGRVLYSVISYM